MVEELQLGERVDKPETWLFQMPSVSVKALDVFNETSGHSPAVFVETEPGISNLNMFSSPEPDRPDQNQNHSAVTSLKLKTEHKEM